MKKVLLYGMIMLLSVAAYAQSTDENYIQTTVFNTTTTDGNVQAKDKQQSVTYYDGLGRPKQQVNKQQGGNKKDVLIPIVYDHAGRNAKNYLPYPTQHSNVYMSNSEVIDSLDAFYITKFPDDINPSAPNPYSETIFETSSLGRPLVVSAPGDDWKHDPDNPTFINPVYGDTISNPHADLSQNLDGNDFLDTTTGATINKSRLSINDGFISIGLDIDFDNGASSILTTGIIATVNTLVSINTVSLGFIQENGVATAYEVTIENNKVVVTYTGGGSPPALTDVYLISSADIRDYTSSLIGYQNVIYNGNTIRSTYSYNIADEVRLFEVTHPGGNTQQITLTYDSNNAYYTANELSKVTTLDENWKSSDGKAKTTEEFTNKSGQVVLKRTYTKENGQDIAHDTYYVYDDFGNLTYVLSPKASDAILITPANTIDTQVLDDLGYQYKYDFRNRLIEKKIPGKGWESIVYDRLDRPVLTQDPNLQAQGKWLFTKYDALGRVTYTGMYTSTQTRAQLQTTINTITTGFNESRVTTPITYTDIDVYYSNTAFPNTNIEVLTVNYYDDYNFGNPDVLLASDDVTLSANYMTQVGNVITKSYQITAWNAGFTTDEKITGDGYIEYTITHNDKRLMLGLSTDSNVDTTFHYGTIDYAIDTGHTDTNVRVWENGTGISTGITCLPGDVFRIERIGTAIYYKKNGVTFYQSAVASTGDLTGDSSFLNHLSEVSNVKLVHTINGQVITGNTQGLTTGSVVRVLDTDKFIHTITQYDEKARATYMASKNEYLGTHDVVTSTYDFVGNVLTTNTSHTKNGVAFGTVSSVLTKDAFTYDHQNRLLTHTQTIDNRAPEVLVENHYDELGQLVQKKTGVTTHDISSTITNINRVAQEGNAISKVVTDNWDGNFETVKTIASNKDGYIEFTITETGKYNMIGLSDPNGTLDNGYTTIDYAIYTGSGTLGNDVRIYENGTVQPMQYTMFDIGDTFKVERIIDPNTNIGEVKYYKNGIEIYSSTVTSNTALIGDASLGKQGSYVKDVRFVILNPEEGQSLQTVDYAYNVRGWLKQINDPSQSLTNDVFAFKINYNTAETSLGAQKLYNGNISETLWRTASDDELHAYGYTYDALNRITSANYAQGTTHNVNTGFYNLNSISYDKNGNILALQRNGADATHTNAISIDDLVYGYGTNSNQLTRVTDTTVNPEGFNDNYVNNGGNSADNDYLYDANGNMILDKNKYITGIEYNHLNLPTKVTFSNQTGGSVDNTIEYIYDATGIKQEKLVTTNFFNDVRVEGTQYAGNMVYTGADLSNAGYFFYVLEFFNHPEGYIEPFSGGKTGTDFRCIYQHKDHLGNIRVAYADYDNDGKIDIVRSNGAGNVDVDGDGDLENEIVQAKNYYPFGLQIKHGANSALSIVNGRNHKYGYNGKEQQDELGLNWSDYGARNYDAALGRWMNLDPLAFKYYSFSPYSFVVNNPIFFIDPDGRQIIMGKNTVDQRNLNQDEINKYMKGLQAMTDDTLRYNKNTGKVEIVKKGSGKKKEGTALLRHVIGHKGKVYLNISTGTESIEIFGEKSYPGAIGGMSGPEEGDSEEFKKAKNGVGSSYTEISIGSTHHYIAKNRESGEISLEEMSFQDILNHEMIHALAQINGESKGGRNGITTLHYYTDANGNNVAERIQYEEALTVGFSGYERAESKKIKGYKYPTENSLRKEQGNSNIRTQYSALGKSGKQIGN